MNKSAANGVTISLTTTAIMRLRTSSSAHKSIGRRLDKSCPAWCGGSGSCITMCDSCECKPSRCKRQQSVQDLRVSQDLRGLSGPETTTNMINTETLKVLVNFISVSIGVANQFVCLVQIIIQVYCLHYLIPTKSKQHQPSLMKSLILQECSGKMTKSVWTKGFHSTRPWTSPLEQRRQDDRACTAKGYHSTSELT